MKLPVKLGLSSLDRPMTAQQAQRHGEKEMPADLKRSGFICKVAQSDPEIHGGLWLRINFTKPDPCYR